MDALNRAVAPCLYRLWTPQEQVRSGRSSGRPLACILYLSSHCCRRFLAFCIICVSYPSVLRSHAVTEKRVVARAAMVPVVEARYWDALFSPFLWSVCLHNLPSPRVLLRVVTVRRRYATPPGVFAPCPYAIVMSPSVVWVRPESETRDIRLAVN